MSEFFYVMVSSMEWVVQSFLVETKDFAYSQGMRVHRMNLTFYIFYMYT